MKKLRNMVVAAILALTMAVLAGCSETSTEVVKKSRLALDKTVTIGKALDGYKYFAKKEWMETKSSDGANLVIFKADMSPQFVKELNEACKSNPHHKKMDAQKWSIQFTMNHDKTVHISGTQTLSVLADKGGEMDGYLSEPLMQSVFKNELASACGGKAD